ncbi:MAG: sensor domain-containing protein [Clostridia bacterium]
MDQTRSDGSGFFDVITDKQTYLSLIYLMLSFPLGIFYFVFIITGFSLGIGLIPIFIGIPLLYVFMISVKCLMRFERKMAALFLGMNIRENTIRREKGVGILIKFKDELFDAELWKAIIYLTFKFFIGIMILVLCITLVSLSLGLIAAPVIYQIVEYNLNMDGGIHFNVDGIQIYGVLGFVGISATPMQEMLMLMLLGVFVGIGSLHLFNKTAYFMGGLLKVMSPALIKD